MVDWTAEQISAYNDIKEDGYVVTVRRPGSSGTWNETTQTYDGATDPTDYPTYAIKARKDIKDASGTLVQIGAEVLLIPAYGLPTDLNANDLIDGKPITQVSPVDPGDVAIIYMVHLG